MDTHTDRPEVLPADTRVGPFQIIHPLNASGGMATLYLAQVRGGYRSHDLPERVALKVAKADYEDFLKTEASLLMQLAGHPHIVRIYPLPGYNSTVYWVADTVKTDRLGNVRLCFMAMEYVEGESLRARLNRRVRHSRLIALGIARQIAAALSYAHDRHIVHLDIKPENILLRCRRLAALRSSVPKVTVCDFGIARDLNSPAAVERAISIDYAPPEMLRESNPAHRTVSYPADVFMLGEVIYEMLTGQVPFAGVPQKLAGTPPRPMNAGRPDISSALEALVMRSLAHEPGARFADANDLRQALARVPMGLDVSFMVRYMLVGIVTAGLIAGATQLLSNSSQNVSTPTPSPVATITPTSNVRPSRTPTIKATSTRAPTRTPTATLRPITLSSTANASGSTPTSVLR